MTKHTITLALLLGGLAAFSGARSLYRIELRDNASVLSNDQPAARGSVLLFHRHPDGLLTAVPSEEVSAVTPVGSTGPRRISTFGTGRIAVSGSGRIRAADSLRVVAMSPAAPRLDAGRPLAPGEVLFLGPTGSGAASAASATGPGPVAPSPSAGIWTSAALEAQVFPGDLPAPSGAQPAMGYGAGALVINPTLGPAAGRGGTLVPGSTAGAQNGTPPISPINPNGFPATTTTGPQSGALPINPNGFPATTATTSPQGATSSMTSPVAIVPGATPVVTNVPGTRGSVQSPAFTRGPGASSISPNSAAVGVSRPSAQSAAPAQAAPAGSSGSGPR